MQSSQLIFGRVSQRTEKGDCLKTHIFKQRQHLRIRRIIRNREGEVRIPQNSRNPNQPGPSTGNDADILPRIGLLPLTVMIIVQLRNRLTQRLNSSRRPILTGRRRNRDRSRTVEASVNIVVCVRSALAQISPFGRILEEPMFAGALGGPDYACGRARRIEPGVGTMTFVRIAELPMGFRC